MRKINNTEAKEFHELMTLKAKSRKRLTREQYAKIRKTWMAMRALPPGQYETTDFTYSIHARKEDKHRSATSVVIFKPKAAKVVQLPVKVVPKQDAKKNNKAS